LAVETVVSGRNTQTIDVRNFYFDVGIVPTLDILKEGQNIDVDTTQLEEVRTPEGKKKTPLGRKIFFVPTRHGKTIMWKHLVRRITVTEQLGGIQLAEVEMVMPLDLGVSIVNSALVTIMGFLLLRYGYIHDSSEFIKSRVPWRVFIIQQPSFAVREGVVTLSFKAVSPLHYLTRIDVNNVALKDPFKTVLTIILDFFEIGLGLKTRVVGKIPTAAITKAGEVVVFAHDRISDALLKKKVITKAQYKDWISGKNSEMISLSMTLGWQG
jgi:hypothetical protein